MQATLSRLATDLAELAQSQSGWAYLLLGLSAFLENVFPPVPGDAVVVISAYLVGRGALAWVPVYAVTCTGGTLGFLVLYALGRKGGPRIARHWGAMKGDRRQRLERWLGRYGALLVLLNRFLSGIRSGIALAAGWGGMPWRKVLPAAALSMALWNGILLGIGIQMGRNWSRVLEWMASYNRLVWGGLLLGGLYLWRRRRISRRAPGSGET